MEDITRINSDINYVVLGKLLALISHQPDSSDTSDIHGLIEAMPQETKEQLSKGLDDLLALFQSNEDSKPVGVTENYFEEDDLWVCPECGATMNLDVDTWVCPECGNTEELTTEQL